MDSSLIHQGRFSEVDTTRGGGAVHGLAVSRFVGDIAWAVDYGSLAHAVYLIVKIMALRSRSMSIAAVVARISRSSTSLPFFCSLALALPVPDCTFYTVTITYVYVRCYDPWYKSVIQLGVGLYGIHNLGPAALGSVYPVETSTSLYNLYISVPVASDGSIFYFCL